MGDTAEQPVVRDDSGEHALAKAEQLEAALHGRPEDDTDGGVLGHLQAIDHRLVKDGFRSTAITALLALSFVLGIASCVLVLGLSDRLGQVDDAVERIEESNVALADAIARVDTAVARAESSAAKGEASATEVANYVRQAQAAQAASGGQNQAVARGLAEIHCIAVALGVTAPTEAQPCP